MGEASKRVVSDLIARHNVEDVLAVCYVHCITEANQTTPAPTATRWNCAAEHIRRAITEIG